MKTKIINKGPLLCFSDIGLLESEIGWGLPDDYKVFLKDFNGGTPEQDCVNVLGLSKNPTDVQVFFGVGRNIKSSDLKWRISNFKEFVEKGLLPVACDSGGNLFCLKFKGPELGVVVYFDNTSLEDVEYYVADSFSNFLNNLYEL